MYKIKLNYTKNLQWWINKRITPLLNQMNFTILKKMFGEILFRQWLTIKFQLMSIHNKGSLIYINIFYLDRAIVIDCFYLIMSKPPCFQFSFEILKSDVIQHSRVTWLKNFFLINLSCHLVL